MKTIKQIYESIINDSRIDFPQETLCMEVWEKKKYSYVLRNEVREQILDIIQTLREQPIFNIIGNVRIIGSICSNQYTAFSDIDVHVLPTNIKKDMTSDELNKKLTEFINSKIDKDKLMIDETHPIQFYFQYNEYQDLMSAGVYEVEQNEWIVEPTIVPLDFNPYDEFKDAFPIIGKYVKEIEECLNIIKEIDTTDKKDSNDLFKKQIKRILEIKLELKEYRRSFSSPTSAAEAEKYRQDKEWHKIDAVFKFIDKFGYLRKITLIEKIVKDDQLTDEEVFKKIKDII